MNTPTPVQRLREAIDEVEGYSAAADEHLPTIICVLRELLETHRLCKRSGSDTSLNYDLQMQEALAATRIEQAIDRALKTEGGAAHDEPE